MNNLYVLQVCAESRHRLESIAKKLGISLKKVQSPLLTPELRDLSLALALAPDDAAVERATKRYAPAVAGFLFATRDIAKGFADGICKVDDTIDLGVCPYFYLSQYVSSMISKIDDFMEDKRVEEG
jgi:hypothetical protein